MEIIREIIDKIKENYDNFKIKAVEFLSKDFI